MQSKQSAEVGSGSCMAMAMVMELPRCIRGAQDQ